MIVTGGTALDFAPQALGESGPLASATGYFYAEQGIDEQVRWAAAVQRLREVLIALPGDVARLVGW